jgi:hypothetical protein
MNPPCSDGKYVTTVTSTIKAQPHPNVLHPFFMVFPFLLQNSAIS